VAAIYPSSRTRLASALTPFDGPMIPALARAISDAMGVDVPEESFRPDMVATYLRLTCRVVGDDGKVVGAKPGDRRSPEQYGARARAIGRRPRRHPRGREKGSLRGISESCLRSWFDAYRARRCAVIPPWSIAGHRGARAARVGRCRRCRVARGRAAASGPCVARCGLRDRASDSAAFSRPNGVLVSRAENEAFRDMVLMRIVDVAFGLEEDAGSRATSVLSIKWSRQVPAHRPVFRLFADAIAAIGRSSTRRWRHSRARRSTRAGGARSSISTRKLEELFPAHLMESVTLPHLQHFPRYLRAAQARLGRAIADPRKTSKSWPPSRPSGPPSSRSAPPRAIPLRRANPLGLRGAARGDLRARVEDPGARVAGQGHCRHDVTSTRVRRAQQDACRRNGIGMAVTSRASAAGQRAPAGLVAGGAALRWR